MTSGGGGKGHRSSGDTAGELVSIPAISFQRKMGGATVVRFRYYKVFRPRRSRGVTHAQTHATIEVSLFV